MPPNSDKIKKYEGEITEMIRVATFFFVLYSTILPLFSVAGQSSAAESYADFLAGVKADAIKQGIDPQVVDQAFKKLKKPKKSLIKHDRNQAEFKSNFATYYQKRGTANLPKGIVNAKRFKTILKEVETQFKVDPVYVLALWGIETRYGAYQGKTSVIEALATLAYDRRRRTFFRKELLHALKIVSEGHIRLEAMKGSWAGAMGQCQFMPSSFVDNAYDADNDGKKDIWHSTKDVLYSIANYLNKKGWVHQGPWGAEVTLKKPLASRYMDMKVTKPLSFWRGKGVTFVQENAHPATTKAALIEVRAQKNGGTRLFLVYDNFKNILKWNKSYLFALTVGHLADAINENGSK